MRPSTTALPPSQRTIRAPTPETSPISGHDTDWTRARARLRVRYSALSRANSAISRSSMVYARTTAMPVRFSWALAESAPSCSCTAVERTSTSWLKRLAITTRPGNGAIANRVSHGSIIHMAPSVPANANRVPISITLPKPASARRAEMSLEARDIRSPVR